MYVKKIVLKNQNRYFILKLKIFNVTITIGDKVEDNKAIIKKKMNQVLLDIEMNKFDKEKLEILKKEYEGLLDQYRKILREEYFPEQREQPEEKGRGTI